MPVTPQLSIPMAQPSGKLKFPKGFHDSALNAANTDPKLWKLLSDSKMAGELAAEVRRLLLLHGYSSPPTPDEVVCQKFIAVLANFRQNGKLGPEAADAIGKRAKAGRTYHNDKHDFTRRVGLDWTQEEIIEFYDKLHPEYLSRLADPYPPINDYICESKAVYDKWYKHVATGHQADTRYRRNGIRMLERGKLHLVVKYDKDVIVRDRDTDDIICIVIRNFCPDPAPLAWLEDVISETAKRCRSIRVSQPTLPIYATNFRLN